MSKWIIGMKVQQMSPACYNRVSYFALLSLNYLPMSGKWRYKRNLYPYLVLWQYGGLRRFSFLRYFSLWTVQKSPCTTKMSLSRELLKLAGAVCVSCRRLNAEHREEEAQWFRIFQMLLGLHFGEVIWKMQPFSPPPERWRDLTDLFYFLENRVAALRNNPRFAYSVCVLELKCNLLQVTIGEAEKFLNRRQWRNTPLTWQCSAV